MVPAILGGAALLGKIFGGAGQGAAQQRLSENQQRLQAADAANRDALSRANLQAQYALSGANLDLAQKQFQQQEPSVQARQAAMGSLLNRIQPLQLSGLSDRVASRMPKMNSILDAIGPEARAAGALLAARGQNGLESGPTQFAPLPQLNLPPAHVAALQKSGLLEKILGTVGLVGSTVGAFGGDPGSIRVREGAPGGSYPLDPYGGG